MTPVKLNIVPVQLWNKQITSDTLVNGNEILQTKVLSVSQYQEPSFLKKLLKCKFKKAKLGLMTRKPVMEITVADGIQTQQESKTVELFLANVSDIRCECINKIVDKNRIRVGIMTTYGQERIYEVDHENQAALEILKFKDLRLSKNSFSLRSTEDLIYFGTEETEANLVNEILAVGYEDDLRKDVGSSCMVNNILGIGFEKNPHNLNSSRSIKGKEPARERY
ncbi:hypothetical protein HK098_000467 [Nowakowskiella sp. JEL0407]|nr:hypothetical protein HK098_000467 [Nowakowskiella sp. JEL0407]